MKLETIEYRGYEIEIHTDDYADSPDVWDDEERFLVFDHRNFYVERKGFNPTDIFKDRERVKGYHVFRCYAYIHSGVVLSVGNNDSWPDQRWDVSFKGFWLIKREKGTWKEEDARKAAELLCDEWNQYLSGDVYGYTSEAGSCWGFYGDDGMTQMIEEAKGEIDSYIELQDKQVPIAI